MDVLDVVNIVDEGGGGGCVEDPAALDTSELTTSIQL
jgi:hypothetical protein